MAATMLPVNLLVEGDTDEVIVRRVLEYVELPCGTVYGKRGKSDLLRRLPNYNQAARFGSWLAVVDLDQDAHCAPDFVRDILPDSLQRFILAVQSLKNW
jgi:hypothetical protein